MKGNRTIKIGKMKYPDKTSINLLVQETDRTDSKTQMILFVIFLIILGLFIKFMVVDKLAAVYDAQNKYQEIEAQIEEFTISNKDYDEVKADYSHYGNSYLNDEEMAEQDRLLILDIIGLRVLPQASIQALEISGNVATLTIEKTSLSTVSRIVDTLEKSSIVSYVSVSTAGTNEESKAAVTATMMITFKSLGGEQ